MAWGVEICKLVIVDVEYTSEYEQALEAEKLRMQNVKGNEKEIDSLVKRIKNLKGEDGAGLSHEKAAEIDQIQFGKISKNIKQVDVGDNIKSIISEGIEKISEKIAEAMVSEKTSRRKRKK